MRGWILFGIVASIFQLHESYAYEVNTEVPLPRAMAAIGDSMSEALLADYSFENGVPLSDMKTMIEIAQNEDTPTKIQMFRDRFAALDKSWSTGLDDFNLVHSHFEKLSEYQSDLVGYNFAVSGSETADLKSQLAELLAVAKEERLVFDYVTVLAGANDIQYESLEEIISPQNFVANLEYTIRGLLQHNPQMAILLVGFPNIFKIFEETRHLQVAGIFGYKYTCDQLRRDIYGPNVGFVHENAEAYSRLKQIVEQYWRGSEALVKRLRKEFPQARLNTLHRYETTQDAYKVISVDCFHPSEWGQAELAEQTWNASFWPELDFGF